MIVVVMGAAGAGKSTVGAALAAALGWPFIDADDFHAPEHVEKMRHGAGLTDEDRQPWLARVHARMRQAATRPGHAVVACSALRSDYRDTLSADIPDVRWVLLEASASLLAERLRVRQGHFAGPALVESQLAALEPPADALTIDANRPVDEIVREIRTELGL